VSAPARAWPEIASWRREQRAALMAARNALPAAAHRAANRAILDRLAASFPDLATRLVGFYWPIRREPDPLPLVRRLVAEGGKAALPVVMGMGRPLEFRPWRPDVAMAVGVYDIPYPVAGPPVAPEVLIVPLLGFDAAGYRLGYGAGFYDRTIAAFAARPRLIGVGFALGRLATIEPQPHDIPMDFIITEDGVFRREGERLAAAGRGR
jgi:5-formyltetrahydrofolate cyclo-ligase